MVEQLGILDDRVLFWMFTFSSLKPHRDAQFFKLFDLQLVDFTHGADCSHDTFDKKVPHAHNYTRRPKFLTTLAVRVPFGLIQ